MTKDDVQEQAVIERMHLFTNAITMKLNDANHVIQPPAEGLTLNNEEMDQNDKPEGDTAPDQDDYTEEAYDVYLGTELLMPHGDSYILGIILVRRKIKRSFLTR